MANKHHALFLKSEIMETKWMRAFILSAGGILLTASLFRFLIAAGHAAVLAQPDPLLGMPLRYAVLLVGTIELVVSFICLFSNQIGLQTMALAWLATSLIVYWGGLIWTHNEPRTACWGTFTDPLHFSGGIMAKIVNLAPFYLVAGSYILGLRIWLSADARTARMVAAQQEAGQRDAAAGLLKMHCPSCGGRVKFAGSNIGQQFPCPHCQTNIILRKQENLKMSCFFCKEHIEFPSHCIGEKIRCPHCEMEITLKTPA